MTGTCNECKETRDNLMHFCVARTMRIVCWECLCELRKQMAPNAPKFVSMSQWRKFLNGLTNKPTEDLVCAFCNEIECKCPPPSVA